MAVKYLAGNRIQGTDAERPLATSTSPPSGWKEVARTTLSGTSDTISVSDIPNMPYYMVLNSIIPSGAVNNVWQLNGDAGGNYAYRYSDNGGTDGTGTSATHMFGSAITDSTPWFSVTYLTNSSGNEKLGYGNYTRQGSSGAGNAPQREEIVGKWSNTSNAISSLLIKNSSGGADYASGSEVVVLGYDPSDTNTANFWEQLASVSGDGTSNTLSTGTTIGKKYIWIQAYLETTGQQKGMFRVGNSSVDGAGSYAFRISNNGGSDAPHDVKGSLTEDMPNALHHFVNIFAINNASNEGLFLGHDVGVVTTGAGTAPIRQEFVGKWANTSNQFNILDVVSGSGDGNWTSKAKLTVWGHD